MFWWKKSKPNVSGTPQAEGGAIQGVIVGQVIENATETADTTTVSMSKEQVIEFLSYQDTVKKAATEIEGMRQDAERIRVTSQRTQDIAILGFIVLLVVVAGLVLDRLMYVWELDGKGQYEKALLQQFQLQSLEVQGVKQELRLLKGCLGAGSWDGCFSN